MKLNSPLASPIHRLVAQLINITIWALILVLLLNAISLATSPEALINSTLTSVIVLLVLGIIIPLLDAFLTSKFGGGIGKLIAGIQVVNPEGQKISFKRAFFRNYIGYTVSAIILYAGFIWILIDKQRQAWHDQVANTYVVTRNQAGILFGAIALAITILIHLTLIPITLNNFKSNSDLYQSIYEQTTREIKESEIDDSSLPEYPFVDPVPNFEEDPLTIPDTNIIR